MTADVSAGPWAPLTVLLVASLVPLAIVGLTSFAKAIVVLGILRHALGTPQVPPPLVATALALVLSLVVMAPLWQEVDQRVAELDQGGWSALWSAEPQRAWTTASEVARRPLLAFLRRNASSENVRFFEELHRQRSPDTLPLGAEFLILAPAFVVTELSEGFLIGFLLFLPFLVVDLFVANLLLALGLQMVSPATVSLPLKLLLFVLADGWALLCQGLVTGYQ